MNNNKISNKIVCINIRCYDHKYNLQRDPFECVSNVKKKFLIECCSTDFCNNENLKKKVTEEFNKGTETLLFFTFLITHGKKLSI